MTVTGRWCIMKSRITLAWMLVIFQIQVQPVPLFRLWFVLKRYNQFGFKPYMTNMEATIEVKGNRNESKK